MKKKTNIRTVIRTIVREEVAMAIQEVITELKKPSLSSEKQLNIVFFPEGRNTANPLQ